MSVILLGPEHLAGLGVDLDRGLGGAARLKKGLRRPEPARAAPYPLFTTAQQV